jgi:hypothetical protein
LIEKAGLAPAFLVNVINRRLLTAAAIRLSFDTLSNKPLMACREHWKSLPVLPMFRTYPLASDLRFPARRARRCAYQRAWKCRYG